MRWFRRGPGPRIWFIAHNANHVGLFRDTATWLDWRGREARFACPMVHARAPEAVAALRDLGREAGDMNDLRRAVRPGDAVICALDDGPPRVQATIEDCNRAGIATAVAVEGCRFDKPARYRTAQKVLVWGPSGAELFGSRAIVTGSPQIERMRSLARMRRESPGLVINYKFTWDDAERDPDRLWLAQVRAAAAAAGLPSVVSVHPASPPQVRAALDEGGVIEDLMLARTALVTRGSTTIYQALMAGVQPFLFSGPSEELLELGEPMGAYPIARDAQHLARLLQDWAQGRVAYDARAFLSRHVSVSRWTSSAARMGRAIESLRRGQRRGDGSAWAGLP
jgi:hypothetical protein